MLTQLQDMLTPEIINIDKNKKIGEIAVRLQRLQKAAYNFVPVPTIQVCWSMPYSLKAVRVTC